MIFFSTSHFPFLHLVLFLFHFLLLFVSTFLWYAKTIPKKQGNGESVPNVAHSCMLQLCNGDKHAIWPILGCIAQVHSLKLKT
jgi:hypothetical protein